MQPLRNNNMSKEADQVYRAYLVRCWLIPPVTTNEPPAWRFELREVPADSEKHRFSDLEQVKEFISAKLAAIAAGSSPNSEKEENRHDGKP
jgi:hypothetical protein